MKKDHLFRAATGGSMSANALCFAAVRWRASPAFS